MKGALIKNKRINERNAYMNILLILASTPNKCDTLCPVYQASAWFMSYLHELSVASGNQALPWDHEEHIPRTQDSQEIVLWQGVLNGNLSLGFQIPISLHPVMEKGQLCLQQGQSTSQCPTFLFYIKA